MLFPIPSRGVFLIFKPSFFRWAVTRMRGGEAYVLQMCRIFCLDRAIYARKHLFVIIETGRFSENSYMAVDNLKRKNLITDKGRLFYAVWLTVIIFVLIVSGFAAYILCIDNPAITHIADAHIDSFSNGLMTYASISMGLILTEFALLLTFASSPFFKDWQRTGKFKLWQTVNLFAVFTSLAVLVSSFILLGWEHTLPAVLAILAANVVCMAMVFIPLLVVAGSLMRSDDQA